MSEDKIPTIEEMKKRAIEIGKNIPNVEEKKEFVKIRGYVIEFAISIERSLNELITKTGRDLVIDPEKKEFHLVKGIRNKKDLPGFKTKTRDMIGLIEDVLSESKNIQKTDNVKEAFNRFEFIRDIFAHVPLDFDSEKSEFDTRLPYKHFFKDPKWKDPSVALSEFMNTYNYLTDILLSYGRHIQLKKELFSRVFFGMSLKDFQREVNQVKEEKKK